MAHTLKTQIIANRRQRGAALILMLVIVVMGIAAVMAGSLGSTALNNERQDKTALAQAQARDALIGYAITYGDTHVDAYGYLPCPDTNNDGSSDTNQGSVYCAGKNIPVVGRLPWKSLGLPPLRDGHGECLWYAVSGSYKAVAGGYINEIMNWDTLGQFTIQDTNGVTLSGATVYDQPTAVIFSAGPPLNAQSHPFNNGQECSGNTGNDVAAYLEGGNAFTPPASPPASPMALTAGNRSSTTNNDAALWVTPGDIFNRLKKRNDFSNFVTTLLSAATACLSSYPAPITINFDAATLDSTSESAGITVGSLIIGRIPYAACTNNLVRQWRDNLLYAACTSGTCLTGGYRGVVIFAGEKNTFLGQQRIFNTDKNTWSNYLENMPSNILTAFTNGDITFSGASSYSAASPSTDVQAFIP